MSKVCVSWIVLALVAGSAGCSSSNGGDPGVHADGGGQGNGSQGDSGSTPSGNGDSGAPANHDAGATSGNDAGTTTSTDAGSTTKTDAGATAVTDAGSTTTTDGGSTSTDAGSGVTSSLTGTLGSLGAVQPIVSSIVISNSGETLVYLSTSTITCTMLQTSRWLGGTTAGSQVVEVVIKGNPSVGQTVAVPPGEVNYAPGGKSSSYETTAASGSITFTRADPQGVVEGTVSATYSANGGGSVSGTFHADFCANGQNY